MRESDTSRVRASRSTGHHRLGNSQLHGNHMSLRPQHQPVTIYTNAVHPSEAPRYTGRLSRVCRMALLDAVIVVRKRFAVSAPMPAIPRLRLRPSTPMLQQTQFLPRRSSAGFRSPPPHRTHTRTTSVCHAIVARALVHPRVLHISTDSGYAHNAKNFVTSTHVYGRP